MVQAQPSGKPGRRCIALTLLLACMVTGCALPGPSKEPAIKTYFLQADEQLEKDRSVRSNAGATLRISTPASAPGFLTSKMAYTSAPRRLDYFAYHEWVDSPAKMIAAMMESRLDHSNLFRAVIVGSPDIPTHYRLDSELQRLQQNFNAEDSQVLLTIKVNLVAVADRSLLGSRTFAYVEPASQANPEEGVAAANRAAQQFLVDLVAFLTESLEQPK